MENLFDCLRILIRFEHPQNCQVYTIELILKQTLEKCLSTLKNEEILDDYEGKAVEDIFYNYELLISILQSHCACQLMTGVSEDVLSIQQRTILKQSMFMLSFSCLNSVLLDGIFASVPWVFKLWQSHRDKDKKVSKIEWYLKSVFSVVSVSNICKDEVSKHLLPHIVLALETLKKLNPDSEFLTCQPDILDKKFSKSLIAEAMIQLLRHRNGKPDSEWFFVSVETKLNQYAMDDDGIKILLNAVDSFSNEKFWQQTVPCNSLVAIILKAACKQPRRAMTKLRQALLTQPDPLHFGLLLPLIIEKSEKLKNLHRAVNTQIIDFICFPADVLWEKEFDYVTWVRHFDKSVFLAQSWLLRKKTGYDDKYSNRLKKFFATILYINGQCKGGKMKNSCRRVVSLLPNFLDGCETSEQKAARLMESFSLLHDARTLPMISNDANENLQITCLSLKHEEEINEIFIDSIKDIINNCREATGIVTCLLVKTMVRWNKDCNTISFIRDLRKVDSEIKYGINWAVLHLMCNLGEWLMEKEDCFEDKEVAIGLLGFVKESFARIEDQVAEIVMNRERLDVPSAFSSDAIIKTAHLSLGLLGGLHIHSTDEQVRGLYDQCIISILKLERTLSENVDSIDEGQKNLMWSIKQFLNLLGKDGITIPTNSNNLSEFETLLESLEEEFFDEENGSIEIAQRGHLVIRLGSMIRKQDKHVYDDVHKVFDVLSHNVSHPDSYVYLSAINALSQLVLWNHSMLLSKLIFLFSNWECHCAGEEIKDCITCTQSQMQLGEAISRVLLELGDISSVYYDKLNAVFMNMLSYQNDMVLSSVLSGFSNLIQVSKGKFLWKNFFELLYACRRLLLDRDNNFVRRASIFLLRTMLNAQDISLLLQNNKEANTELILALKQSRLTDSDEVVRLHADLALSDIAELVKQQIMVDSVEKNTRVLQL